MPIDHRSIDGQRCIDFDPHEKALDISTRGLIIECRFERDLLPAARGHVNHGWKVDDAVVEEDGTTGFVRDVENDLDRFRPWIAESDNGVEGRSVARIPVPHQSWQ